MIAGLRLGGVLLFISLLSASVQAQQPERSPVPDDLSQGESRKAAADLYKSDYTKSKGNKAALAKLAKRMLEDAAKAEDDLVSYYVLLDLAKSVAVEAGDAETAMSAVDQIGESFEIDTLNVKADCLRKIGSSRTGDIDYKALAEQAFSLLDDTASGNKYELATELATKARDWARRAKQYELAKKALARTKEIETQAGHFKRYQDALKTLEGDPGNAESNSAAGHYLCLQKGDWERGVTYLALGSDKALKTAAEKELLGATDANERLAVAEAWWEAAERAKGKDKEALMLRAGGWYEQAEKSGVSGMAKIKVDNRLRDIAKIGQPIPDVSSVAERRKPRPRRVGLSVRKGQPPELIKAPFDMVRAEEYQKAWADHLGVPVERDFDFPDGQKLTVVLIPPGEFMMGSPEPEQDLALDETKASALTWMIGRIPTEGPQHRVKITKPFYLGKHEVTQGQWQTVMGDNPSHFTAPVNPVEQVSWDDLQPFLVKLNTAYEKEGLKFALPTEAQWEYACRAGTTTAFYFGDNWGMLSHHGWFGGPGGNSGNKAHPVGQGRPNAWGLHDTHGNVWEWCADWHGAYSAQSPQIAPVGPQAGRSRVFRGGAWMYPPEHCRSASRHAGQPSWQRDNLGFRVAAILPEKPSE